jgi:hypothetical protein
MAAGIRTGGLCHGLDDAVQGQAQRHEIVGRIAKGVPSFRDVYFLFRPSMDFVTVIGTASHARPRGQE